MLLIVVVPPRAEVAERIGRGSLNAWESTTSR